MAEKETTSPAEAIGGLLGLVFALYLFGPCAKPTHTKWTHEGDGSFETWRRSENAKEEIRKEIERGDRIKKILATCWMH